MSTSTIPLWGQAWELVVTYATEGGAEQATIASKTWTPDALRVTFEVLQAMNSSPFWYADISIYNMNDQAVQNILLNATWVTLRAGFMTGENLYATIWDGPVFQPIFTREAVVDQKVTLHCVANPFVMDSIVGFATGPFSTQTQLVAKMASQINLPPVSTAQGTLGAVAEQRMSVTQYPRGNGVFGKTSRYLAQIADSNFLQMWQDGQQAYISEVDSGNREPQLVYSPPLDPAYTDQMLNIPIGTTRSLIGTPRQTQQGVTFEVLLDPRLKVGLPPLVVQLARTQVAQLVQTPTPASGSIPTALSSNLTFFVAQVRHVGDTRGNEWYTEVTGYSTAYAQTLLNLFT